MTRYTIEMSSNIKTLDMGTIQRQLEDRLSMSHTSVRIRLSEQFGASGTIMFETDFPTDKLIEIIRELHSKTNVNVTAVRWGWIIPSNLQDRLIFDEQEKDPFFYAIPITDESKVAIYNYSLIGKIFLLINIIFLLFGIVILYLGYSNSERLQSWFGLFVSCIFAYAILNTLLNISIDNNSITFRYLIKPSIKVNWSEISTLRIFQARGEWCAIYAGHQKVELPLARFYDKPTENKLLKSIIVHANLYFVESSSNGVIYKQPDNIR